MSDEYGFMAELDGDVLTLSDSTGGGTTIRVSGYYEAMNDIAAYIQRNAEYFAEMILEDLGIEEPTGDDEKEA